jgi:hypothetical protein
MMQSGDTPASNLGGAPFQALVEANCRMDPSKNKKDDEIEFKYRYDPYDRCEQRYQCPNE